MKKEERYTATVVDGRLYVPDELLYFTRKEYVVTRGVNGSLYLFTSEDWVNYYKQLKQMIKEGDEMRRKYRNFLASGATDVEMNENRNIKMPKILLEFAQIPNKGMVKVELVPRIEFQDVFGIKKGSLLAGTADGSFAIMVV